ncbi:MAG TPA: 3-dehydroquinate synthase [Polyangiaceae bacterium]|nr:3-dehydroquinate synthase [Polyangiaceae bacterium]
MRYDQRFSFTFDYPVYFTNGAFSPASSVLVEALSRREANRKHRVGVVIERRVAELWPAVIGEIQALAAKQPEQFEVAGVKIVEGGEDCKNEEAPTALLTWFNDLALDRQSVVLAIGGGAMQDLVGFAAAVTHRGLRMLRVPTTVLGQSDSGIGVKNGVNAFGKKNALGTFATPFAVINDFDFLTTLSPRDRIAGMAEAVKVALIKDPSFFEWLWNHAEALRAFEASAVGTLVQRCAELHLQHIATSGDPFEMGSARPLDFGHWAAHKLESLSHYSLRHGEAVAIGLALDTRYSAEMKMLSPAAAERVVVLLERLGFKLWSDLLDLRETQGRRVVIAGLEEFREHLGGQLCVTLLKAIGQGQEVHALSAQHIDSSIDWLSARCHSSPGLAPHLMTST